MRLLIVEDDPDGREMLAELFRSRAWDVTDVATTDLALAALRGGGFDLVISDENLEGHSGSSMLREAAAAGLLSNVGALMYTAEPGRLDVPIGCRVLRKPLGIALLLDEATAAVPEPSGTLAPAPGSGDRVRRSPPVELTIYATDSPSSGRAMRDAKRVIEERRGSPSQPQSQSARGEAPPSSRY